ncbi:hypothetical protein AXG93_1593s1750 [Marchantia polymorpha subsp. ruderalis]|uniref:Uncharacterized protein n=3 Tax=Marchantia polymorpha TaxID=3197 RepID=A0A176WPK6_MARPO|nr:hypothetical protein AXG93_1593s1750 [Marchantia polymorpha subsp. ruderalis]
MGRPICDFTEALQQLNKQRGGGETRLSTSCGFGGVLESMMGPGRGGPGQARVWGGAHSRRPTGDGGEGEGGQQLARARGLAELSSARRSGGGVLLVGGRSSSANSDDTIGDGRTDFIGEPFVDITLIAQGHSSSVKFRIDRRSSHLEHFSSKVVVHDSLVFSSSRAIAGRAAAVASQHLEKLIHYNLYDDDDDDEEVPSGWSSEGAAEGGGRGRGRGGADGFAHGGQRLGSTSVVANIQQWTTSPSSWSMRSPPPVISSPVVNNYSTSPGPTVSQMWYDLSVSSSNSCSSPKVTVSHPLKPPPSPSPSGKQRFMFKRCGTNANANGTNSEGKNCAAAAGGSDSYSASNGPESPSSSDDGSGNASGDEKLESSEYLTVFVGERSCKRVKYVISKHFLRHHLFQVLLKCSEDEVGVENEFRGGVPIVCDPALFVQLVTVVGATLFAEIPADSK